VAGNIVVVIALEELEAPGSNHVAKTIMDRHAGCSMSVYAQREELFVLRWFGV
jgi:hypothetical protein